MSVQGRARCPLLRAREFWFVLMGFVVGVAVGVTWQPAVGVTNVEDQTITTPVPPSLTPVTETLRPFSMQTPQDITCPSLSREMQEKKILDMSKWTQYSARCKIGQGMWKAINSAAYVKIGYALKAVLGFSKSSRILDAASGCGNLMHEYLLRHHVDLAVGFDTEPRAVFHTSASLRKKFLPKRFLVCRSDARNISWLPSQYFDALIAHALCLHCVKK